MILRSRLAAAALFVPTFISSMAAGQAPTEPTESGAPAAAPVAPAQGPRENQLLSVQPRSLAAMRLHRAAFPEEASLRCAVLEPCVLGLTRGFAIGSDLGSTLRSLVVQQHIRAGAWLSLDGFVGFQFLDGVDKTFWANGTLGYRKVRYIDSNDNEVAVSGFTGTIDFSQEIVGPYTQGLRFEAVFSRDDDLSAPERLYLNSNPGAHTRKALDSFFEYSHRRPTFWVSLPANVEMLNWKASHIDLPSDLRGYLQGEPFFAQNDFALKDGFSWSEQDFGVRTSAILAYESGRERISGRFGLKGQVGAEFAFAREKHKTKAIPEAGVEFDLPKRPGASLFADLEASWQF